MESPSINLLDVLAEIAIRRAGDCIWRAFCCRERVAFAAHSRPNQGEYWREISPLIRQVGQNPVLVVSESAERQPLQRLLFARPSDRPNLNIERRLDKNTYRIYIATIEGVDVYSKNLAPGSAWLFSAQALNSVKYRVLDQQLRHVEVDYQPDDTSKGSLEVRFSQHLEWADTPIFEIREPDFSD